jgi:hypothetical protein
MRRQKRRGSGKVKIKSTKELDLKEAIACQKKKDRVRESG